MIYALCFLAGLLVGPIAIAVFNWWDLQPYVFDNRNKKVKK